MLPLVACKIDRSRPLLTHISNGPESSRPRSRSRPPHQCSKSRGRPGGNRGRMVLNAPGTARCELPLSPVAEGDPLQGGTHHGPAVETQNGPPPPQNAEYRRKLLDTGSITVARVMLILQQWDPMLKLKKDNHSKVPVWIRMRNIPLVLWSSKGISGIASLIGKPLFVDQNTEQLKQVAYARVCVELSASDARKETVKVRLKGAPRMVSIEYEWRPVSYNQCGIFGHRCGPDENSFGQAIPPVGSDTQPTEQWRVQASKKCPLRRKAGAQEPRPISPSSAPSPSSDSRSRNKEAIRFDDALKQLAKASQVIPEFPSKNFSSADDLDNADDVGIMGPVRQSKVRLFVWSHDICCLGLMETKVPPHHFGPISSSLLPKWQWLANYEFLAKGRIWIDWNPILVDFSSHFVSSQMIHGLARILHTGSTLHLSAIYGDHTFTARRPLWTDLIRLSTTLLDSPWIVGGDFNAIWDPSDRQGNPDIWHPSFDEFKECLFQAELDDLHYTGFRFTWSSYSGENRKQWKIDRVLVNNKWSSEYSYSEASFLPPGISNHTPMLVRILANRTRKKPFKFFNFWMTHLDFSSMVSQAWEHQSSGTPMYNLCTKLKLLKGKLKQLNKELYSDISMRSANSALVEFEMAQTREYYVLRSLEESFFKQKSRIRWLKEGNQNIRFFHHTINHHHLRNRIITIQDGAGNMVSELEEVQQAFVSYFQELLAPANTALRPTTGEDIRNAMFSLVGGKAPGPNGFNAKIFKKNWDT
ncbi:hypothetical protein BT93_L0631 [Corymbia citriodora subsp. variegata]|uniref:Endonuclease/exonuclease/phosphatase domain-containing protein n=1 Tax=Corymbia citriodora subsp. variegata TaxID=360336 RepID=A0A8T0CS19_CORYI|nr:hypothetical protein BT93_L0631 [Corymbia citriodora subsp. variegata]